MDKKSKILIWVFVVLIIGSVGVTYWRIVIKKDYIIQSQVDCDPYTEKCFIWKCDPTSMVEGEACTGDPEKDIWYYKIAQRNASRIPLCDPNTDETCLPFLCEPGEKDCSETLCDDQTKMEQKVECNDPEKYTLENPLEEEEACDPETDSKCVPDEEGAEEATGEGSNLEEAVTEEPADIINAKNPNASEVE